AEGALFGATNGASSTLVAELLGTSSLARTGSARTNADNENQRRTDSGDSYRTAVSDLHLTPRRFVPCRHEYPRRLVVIPKRTLVAATCLAVLSFSVRAEPPAEPPAPPSERVAIDGTTERVLLDACAFLRS